MDSSSPLEEFSDGYDENLMGDEEDRRKLAQMTEKEREQELFNRSERRETLKIRFEIERKLRSKAKKRELDKKQSKQAKSRKRLRASEVYSSDESSEDSDEYIPEVSKNNLNELNSGAESTTKMNTRSSLAVASSSSSSASSDSSSSSASSPSPSSSSESEPEDGSFEADDDQQVVQDNFYMTLADLKSIQLRREKIEEWVYTPFFRDTAIGLFVKISVGNHPVTKMHMYKVAQIVDITKGHRPYPLNMGKNKTDKHCVVRIGRVERSYQMSFVSNRVFDEEDYNKWIHDQIEIDGQEMPSREYFNKKKKDFNNAINYEFNDKDIAFQVAERSRFNDNPYNFALKKTELMAEKADAEAAYDFEKAREIQIKIDDLEEKARELERLRSSDKFSGISIVNERNRVKNIVESERVLKESKNVKTEDPFTRRKCTPTIVSNKNNSGLQDPTQNDKNDKDSAKSADDKGATRNNLINKTIPTLESVKPVDDLFQVHSSIDLELDIDI